MTELRLTTTPTFSEVVTASNIMASRHLGPAGRLIILAAIVCGALAGGVGFAAASGLEIYDAVLTSMFAFYGAVGAFVVVRYVVARSHRAAAADSNTLGKPRDLIFTSSGVILPERHLPWNGFAGTQRWRSLTLLMSSKVDGLVVPDRDLPPGMTASDFARLIEQWKQEASLAPAKRES